MKKFPDGAIIYNDIRIITTGRRNSGRISYLMETINVTVWNEYIHERSGRVAEIYPGGIHGAIAEMLGRDKKYNIRTATLDMPENGLPKEVLDNTDVLIRWGHCAHDKVSDEVAIRVKNRVLDGMGLPSCIPGICRSCSSCS